MAGKAYFCINIRSRASWGLTPKLMQAMLDLKLDVIDHRSWHAKFENIVINEMYVKSTIENRNPTLHPSPDETLQAIKAHLEKCICQQVSHL